MKNAAIYLRRSTDKQETSIDDQRTFLQGFAARTGLKIVAEYKDEGISGADTEKRADFQRMIKEAGQRPVFELILTYDQSRFGRFNLHKLGYYMTILNEAGIELVFATEPTQEGMIGRITTAFKQEQGHEVVLKASADTIRGLASRIISGHSAGMPQPYGYDQQVIGPSNEVRLTYRLTRRADKKAGTPKEHLVTRPDGITETWRGEITKAQDDKTRLVLGDPTAVETVQRIFKTYAERNAGFKCIAKLLNEDGVPSPRGGQWQASSIKAILENPVYTGDLCWNRRSESEYHRISRGDGFPYRVNAKPGILQKKVLHNDPKDWLSRENAHEPIIGRDLFEKVKAKLARRGAEPRNRGRALSSPYLLSNFLHCSTCERVLWGKAITNGKKAKYAYYRCSSHEKNPNHPCKGSVPADAVEFSLLDWTIKKFDLKRVRADVESEVRRMLAAERRHTPASETKSIRAEIEAIKARTDALLDKVDVLSKEDINRKLTQWKERQARLEADLAASEKSVPQIKSAEERTREALALFDNLKEAMRTFDKLALQQLLRFFISDVKVDFESREILVEYRPEGLAGNETGAPSEEGPSFRTIGSGGGI